MKINVRVEKPLYAYEIEKIIEKYEVLYGLVMVNYHPTSRLAS